MNKKQYLLCAALGFISGLGFAPSSWVWVLFITYSLFFYFLQKATTKRSLFMTGFSFGFGLGAMSMSWLVNALLIDAAAFGWLTPLVPLGFGLFFGLFFGVPALLCAWTPKPIARVLMFAGTFTIFEWVRSWLFTGFPWNLTGSVWIALLPTLQTVSVIGIYGLSLFSLLWFAVPYFFYKKHYFFASAILTSFVLFSGLGALRLAEATHENVWGVQLRLVQPNIPQSLKWDKDAAEENFMKHIRLSKTAPNDKITHILWSEAASPYLLDVDEQALAMTISAVPQDGVLITGSMRVADAAKRQIANSIFVIDDVGQIRSFYDKSHLVPFGEYVPLRGILPFDKLVPFSSDIKAGAHVKTLAVPGAPPMGALICYEIIFPHQVVDSKFRPSWIFNATNDGWYGLSAGPYQHLGSAQIRAVEEGLPVVRVAGSGISAVISPWGEILSSIPLHREGILDSPLPKAHSRIPLYARLGNIIPLILAVLCILWSIILTKKKK